MHVIRIFSFLFLVGLVACTSPEPVRKGIFTVQPIPGWQVDSTFQDGQQHLVMQAPEVYTSHTGSENIIISVEKVPAQQGIDSYLMTIDQAVKKSMSNVKKLGKNTLRIGENDFTSVHYSFLPSPESMEVEQLVYCLKRGNRVYLVVCTTVKGGMEAMQPNIDAVLKSFKIN